MTARLKGRRRHALLLIEDLASWARQQPGIEGVAVVGSYARGQERMASDLDVMILATDLPGLAPTNGWFRRLRPGSRLVRVATWGPVREQRYRLRCGLLVEIDVAAPAWAQIPLDAGTRRVLSDGHRIVDDPKHLFGRAAGSISGGGHPARSAANSRREPNGSPGERRALRAKAPL